MKEEFGTILRTIFSITEELRESAERNDWPRFVELLDRRQRSLESLAAFASNETEKVQAERLPQPELTAPERDEVASELQKVSKVDRDVFDIISKKKTEALENIANVNKGLEFLKSQRRDLNQEKLFSKLY